MSATLDTLSTVLTKVQQNRLNITQQITASTKALGNPDADVQAAIDLLIKTYGTNVQQIGQTIGAQLQIEQLETALVEVDAMIAGLQVLLSDEALVEATGVLATANAVNGDSPLSDAAGDSTLAAANEGASAPPAAELTKAVVEGTASAPSGTSNGASA